MGKGVGESLKDNTLNKKIPKWISVVSILITLLGLFVGISLYLSPNSFIQNVDFSATGVSFLIGMWAARQIAIAAIIGYSVIKQSAPMLKISLIAYALMNLQDIAIGVSRSDSGLIVGAFIFGTLSISMIIILTLKSKVDSKI